MAYKKQVVDWRLCDAEDVTRAMDQAVEEQL